MLTVTEAAKSKVLELLKAQGREGLHLRAAIAGRGPDGFQYRLGFVGDPWFAPRLTRVRTISSGGTSKVEPSSVRFI